MLNLPQTNTAEGDMDTHDNKQVFTDEPYFSTNKLYL